MFYKKYLLLGIVLFSSQIFSQSSQMDAFLSAKTRFLSAASSKLKDGHANIQFGGYWSSQGKTQHININGLIGDQFTATQQRDSNGLVGLGYFVEGLKRGQYTITYGLNAFYLAPTRVAGNVTQENAFTNLSYNYKVTHYPLYAVGKAIVGTEASHYNYTFNAGIGPNFMHTNAFKEGRLNEQTEPDAVFSGHTTTTFSASAGAGIKLNRVVGNAPLECGYRFFYLGKGHFNIYNDQVQNSLNTGNAYANALMCALVV